MKLFNADLLKRVLRCWSDAVAVAVAEPDDD